MIIVLELAACSLADYRLPSADRLRENTHSITPRNNKPLFCTLFSYDAWCIFGRISDNSGSVTLESHLADTLSHGAYLFTTPPSWGHHARKPLASVLYPSQTLMFVRSTRRELRWWVLMTPSPWLSTWCQMIQLHSRLRTGQFLYYEITSNMNFYCSQLTNTTPSSFHPSIVHTHPG